MSTIQKDAANLPIRCNLAIEYVVSLLIATLMTIASIAGLLYQTTIYPTEELLQSFVPNDVVNLVIGLPILLGSMWLTWRGKLIGLLLWPGSLLYVFYVYLIYIFSMPFNFAFPLYLTLVMLSAYAMIGLLACIDSNAVQNRLAGAVPERVGGGILASLGILFFLRVIYVLITTLINQTPLPATELALHVADFLISPATIIGGVLLWWRKSFGYVTGLGLLFQYSMLFIGLIFVFIIHPFITDAQFMLIDVLVIFVMGLVCFIPFILFVRGVVSKGKSSTA